MAKLECLEDRKLERLQRAAIRYTCAKWQLATFQECTLNAIKKGKAVFKKLQTKINSENTEEKEDVTLIWSALELSQIELMLNYWKLRSKIARMLPQKNVWYVLYQFSKEKIRRNALGDIEIAPFEPDDTWDQGLDNCLII